MTRNDDHIGRDADSTLAAEYVLGVLEPAVHAAAARRLGSDASFAALVAFWEERLYTVAGAAPEAPPPHLWDRIEQVIDPPGRTRQQAAPLWESLRFWRWLSVGSLGLAAACLAALLVPGPWKDAPQPLVARLAPADQGQAFLASFDPARGELLIMPAADSSDGARVPELWLLDQSGTPHSLGVFTPGRPSRMSIPQTMRDDLKGGATLAISLEPAGGSPTGRPTGPVIASGTLSGI